MFDIIGGDVFEGVDLTEDSDCEPVTVVAINDTAKVKKVKSVIPECEKVKVNLREQETELKQVCPLYSMIKKSMIY